MKNTAAGASHDSPRAQTCTFEGPGLQNTAKTQREDPLGREERMKIGEGGKKKKRNFGSLAEGERGSGEAGRGSGGSGGPGEGRLGHFDKI